MIEVENLCKHYATETGLASLLTGNRKPPVRAVDGVGFRVTNGEVLGLVGESGCGKSTLMRTLCGLEKPTSGAIRFAGQDSHSLQSADRKAFHKLVQMVFQDPYGSLNPQHTVGDIVSRPLIYQKAGLNRDELKSRAIRVLEEAGLKPAADFLDKYPHQLSGGQRQRVCIARAIVLEPELLIADEPISMLDVSIKWGIIRLLKSLVKDRNLAMIYVTHDLASVTSICDSLAIMYLGRIVECGSTRSVIANPQHPYTRILLTATPSVDPDARRQPVRIVGGIPNAIDIPSGCRFHPRCPEAIGACRHTDPEPVVSGNHSAACHLPKRETPKQEYEQETVIR